MRWNKRFGGFLSVAVVILMLFGMAYKASAALMGGSIQGTQINVEPAVVSTLAGAANITGSTDGTGSAARFYYPQYMTTDGANLYVAEHENHVIRKIVIATGEVTTIAGLAGTSGSADGTGSAARFKTPRGITTDGANLYVTDYGNHIIRKIVIATGSVTTIAGTVGVIGSTDGTGPAASFNQPAGITTDGANLYVAEIANRIIRKIALATAAVTTIAGAANITGSTDATGSAARFSWPNGITTDGTNLYITDTDSRTIRKMALATGAVTTIAGTAGVIGSTDGTGPAASFDWPEGITTDGTNLYITEFVKNTVRKIAPATGVVTTIAGTAGVTGSTDATGSAASFDAPKGITTDGTNLYVGGLYNNTIRKITGGTTSGTFVLSSTSQTFTSTAGTAGITVTGAGAWTATSSLSWVTITSGSSGTGNGTVTISVAANTTGFTRTGNITIAGQTVVITQASNYPVYLDITTPSFSLTSYSTIQAAYNANTAATGSTILVQGVTLTEALVFNQNNSITLTGGFEETFNTFGGTMTTVQGSLTISGGTVTVANIVIQ